MAQRIRVLHVVGGLNRGGSETWLMNVARTLAPEGIACDFVVHTPGPFDYEDELRSLGSRILLVPRGRNPLEYALRLRRTLLREGPFAAVHSHVYLFSGVVLAAARSAGIGSRIVHAHTARVEQRCLRRLYALGARAAIRLNATRGLAVSDAAACAFFGSHWRRDPRWAVAHCGIPLEPFRRASERASVRQEFGIPSNSFLVGHVGRFVPEKNHQFLLQVIRSAYASRRDIHLLLIGDGPLRADVERTAQALGLSHVVTFSGVRPDVARLLSAVDVFLFPSLFEGLPLSVVEAQASGVPVLMSDRVTPEVQVVPGMVRSMPLSAPPHTWAETLLEVAFVADTSRADALSHLERSDFAVEVSAKRLKDLYLHARAPPDVR